MRNRLYQYAHWKLKALHKGDFTRNRVPLHSQNREECPYSSSTKQPTSGTIEDRQWKYHHPPILAMAYVQHPYLGIFTLDSQYRSNRPQNHLLSTKTSWEAPRGQSVKAPNFALNVSSGHLYSVQTIMTMTFNNRRQEKGLLMSSKWCSPWHHARIFMKSLESAKVGYPALHAHFYMK
jgi:hypothetical protein